MRIDVDGLTPVEKTALLTLHARALDSRRSRPILNDSLADEVTRKIDYDFDSVRVRPSVGCPVALRGKLLDERVLRFTAEHPDAVVVDLGAGLSSGVARCRPPARVDWYNVDLPAVIALRNKVLPAGPQEHAVAVKIGVPGWADAIATDRPAILVADGLTGFLSEPELANLFQTVTARFRTGELAFNDYGRVGRVSRAALKLVPQGAGKAFANAGFADPRRPEKWNPSLKLVEEVSLFHAPEVELFPAQLRWYARLAGHVPALARKWRLLRYSF